MIDALIYAFAAYTIIVFIVVAIKKRRTWLPKPKTNKRPWSDEKKAKAGRNQKANL